MVLMGKQRKFCNFSFEKFLIFFIQTFENLSSVKVFIERQRVLLPLNILVK